jgi:hypothetical protein
MWLIRDALDEKDVVLENVSVYVVLIENLCMCLQVTRVQRVFELESNAAKVGIPLTEKIYIFICIGLIKIYILLLKLNQPYDEMYML